VTNTGEDGTSLDGFTLWLMMMMMICAAVLALLGTTLHTQAVLPYRRDLKCNLNTLTAAIVKMNVI
jgi:Tfp pilus assembly protein PilE